MATSQDEQPPPELPLFGGLECTGLPAAIDLELFADAWDDHSLGTILA